MNCTSRKALSLLFSGLFLCTQTAAALPSYHAVGWTNLLVPGGGEFLFGRYRLGAEQAGLELGTFVWGYSISARTPFTLDGVPEDLPSPEIGLFQKSDVSFICVAPKANGSCAQYRKIHKSYLVADYDSTPKDITKPLFADILQEIGLKAHMVNLYDSYREAAAVQGIDFNIAEIDPTPTKDLFLAPFDHNNVLDSWVWIPLVLTAGALYYSYRTLQPSDYATLPPFTTASKIMYSTTYLAVFPVGSAVPEEMFYRGFLQSEAYAATGTAWASVPISTTLYALSHSPDEQLAAAVSGLFLGYLTHHEHGHLKLGVAYHFWSDIMTGIYSIAVIKLGQKQAANTPPATVNFNFTF